MGYFVLLVVGVVLSLTLVNGQVEVKLYEGRGFEGPSTDFTIDASRCSTLYGDWTNSVNSINLNKHCIEVFDGTQCDGTGRVINGNTQRGAIWSYDLSAVGYGGRVRSIKVCGGQGGV